MSKKPKFQSTKYLAVILLFAFSVIACALGGEATQSPEAESPVQTQAQSLPVETAAPAGQGEPSQEDLNGILFQDDFQDGQPDNWKITSAWDVHQTGNIYNFSAATRGGAWIPAGYNWSDYSFETDALLQAGSLILSFDYTDLGRYMLHLRDDGLFLVRENPAGNYAVLNHTGPVAMGQWHRITINNKEGRVQVYVDDELWIDTLDTQPLSKGTIAVSTLNNSKAVVDNVLVNKLVEPLEESQIVAPPPVANAQVIEDELEEISDVIPVEIIQPIAEPVLAPPQEAPEEEQAAAPVEVPSDDEQLPPQAVPVDQDQAESDLTIVDVVLPSVINQGTPFSVSVTIHNAGPDPAVPYTVLWYPDGLTFIGCSWDIYDQQTGPDNRITVTCQYAGYPNPGTFTWIALADPEGVTNDFAPTGNERSGTIIVRPK